MIRLLVLVLAMTATTFLTQRQLMSKNMPADAMSGPYAQQQKMLLYLMPIFFAISGYLLGRPFVTAIVAGQVMLGKVAPALGR